MPRAYGVIFGPIGMDRPTPAGGSIANNQPPSSFFQGFSPPYPTNDWWIGYGAGNGTAYVSFSIPNCGSDIFFCSMVAGPFPYQSSLSARTINFGISTSRNFDGVSIHQPSQLDWSVGFVEHNGNEQNHKALSWVE
jgi:endo-1,3(4)-beta-glucanase